MQCLQARWHAAHHLRHSRLILPPPRNTHHNQGTHTEVDPFHDEVQDDPFLHGEEDEAFLHGQEDEQVEDGEVDAGFGFGMDPGLGPGFDHIDMSPEVQPAAQIGSLPDSQEDEGAEVEQAEDGGSPARPLQHPSGLGWSLAALHFHFCAGKVGESMSTGCGRGMGSSKGIAGGSHSGMCKERGIDMAGRVLQSQLLPQPQQQSQMLSLSQLMSCPQPQSQQQAWSQSQASTQQQARSQLQRQQRKDADRNDHSHVSTEAHASSHADGMEADHAERAANRDVTHADALNPEGRHAHADPTDPADPSGTRVHADAGGNQHGIGGFDAHAVWVDAQEAAAKRASEVVAREDLEGRAALQDALGLE